MTAEPRAVRADAVGTVRELLGIAPKIDDVIFCCFSQTDLELTSGPFVIRDL